MIAAPLGLFVVLGFAAGAALESPNFVENFFQQDSWDTSIFLGVPALIYAGVLALLAPLFARRFPAIQAKPFSVALVLSLLAFVAGVTMFEALALYLRYEPHGTGRERHGADRDTFVLWAEIGFFSLYTFIVVLAAAIGRALHGWGLAAASVVATVGFMVLSFPAVEFVNACDIGEPVFSFSDAAC